MSFIRIFNFKTPPQYLTKNKAFMKKILFTILSLSIIYTISCTYTIKIKDGKTAYDRKQYAVATNLLQKEYNKGKTKAEKGKIAYQLAESYRQLHDDSKAATWYINSF